ncbi:MAG: hypothetical protein WBB45_13545 [Cyclobacteriaceae bacterium]
MALILGSITEIVTDSCLDLGQHLKLEKMEQSPEVIAYLYRELLNARWKWVRKDKFLHFYLHVPFNTAADYSNNSLSA